jgi:hypothetical protein
VAELFSTDEFVRLGMLPQLDPTSEVPRRRSPQAPCVFLAALPYRTSQEKGKKLPIDLTVTVLTTGFWPTYKSIEVALPREMVEGVEVYRFYYDSDSKHRQACVTPCLSK